MNKLRQLKNDLKELKHALLYDVGLGGISERHVLSAIKRVKDKIRELEYSNG